MKISGMEAVRQQRFPQCERRLRTHRMRRSPSALGEEGLVPISLSFCVMKEGVSRAWKRMVRNEELR